MNNLRQATQSGNNIEAAKAKRIVINLFDTTGVNTNVFGKYYFDEYPELNNKIIVGIKFNSNLGDNQVYSNDFAQFRTYADNNIGKFAIYADDATAQNLMLNLFNEKNELILQNFPLNSLNPPITNINVAGKIKPFNTKLNLKASYIFSTLLFSATDPTSVSLTFYYLDK